MTDKIFIQALKVECIIGIFDWERKTPQRILIDLEFPADIRRAAATDHIDDTVDYKRIAKRMLEYVSKSSFQLIETLAEKLAALLLAEFGLRSVTLRVSKPGAVRGSKNVGVEITRHKHTRKSRRAKKVSKK